jgi:hypothetical protein
MPGEIDPANRLLQAVCYPGHGLLLRGGNLVLASGEPNIIVALERVANERKDDAFTVRFDEGLFACVRRAFDHTLAVLVPVAIDPTVVHKRMGNALALYARATPWIPWGDRGGGSGFPPSGAPSELSARPVLRRPS